MSILILIGEKPKDLLDYLEVKADYLDKQANTGANSAPLRKEYSALLEKVRSLMAIIVYDRFKERTKQFENKVEELNGQIEEIKRRLDSLEQFAQTAATVSKIAHFVDQALATAAGIAF
ncbi:MAG: hypothetical protein R3D26_16780 [Cyanobacteriota/Melainabacteria group bacterium]